ncbi:relaxase/mobilization nuclease domain-containing protein [Rhodopseudomonas sp.]|uniref:relaxase/mobilization nuclease domain-containing protein n=1 Tax=Rhodopseudomonas sp. TaxID=1078 RepID=UPI003B3B470E
MILKGSQRGGPKQLAAHLLHQRDNDHIVVHEVRGFMASNLQGAMLEAGAIAKGTRCRQPVFSLSLNPPKEVDVPLSAFLDAADRAEETLGLKDQPRAIVIHEKEGRRHAHVVWSRIDADQMKAINLSHYKNKLRELSKELYLEHEWKLPEGHRENGWKNPLNFTLAEWQQAKRLDLDPREIKQVFRDAWDRSDNLASFRQALEERGYYLAKGDRRGIVATDMSGQVYAVSRWSGIKTKELKERLGDGAQLPSVAEAQAGIGKQLSAGLRKQLEADKNDQKAQLDAAKNDLRKVVMKQRAERAQLSSRQKTRQAMEAKERAGKFRRGLGIVLDVLSGRLFKLRKQNEAEAYASFVRDRRETDQLHDAQAKERAPYQERIDSLRTQQKADRAMLARQLAVILDIRRTQGGRDREREADQELQLGM